MNHVTQLGTRVTYDAEADAMAIRLPQLGSSYAESEELAPGVIVDFDAQGRVIGIQLLDVRQIIADGRRDGEGTTP